MGSVTYAQTREDLERLLREQVTFLRRSAEAYDAGDEAEAKRLATHVRVLVHDTESSHSLLGLLGVKEQLGYEDTTIRRIEMPPGYDALPRGSIVIHSGIVMTRMQLGPEGSVRFAPPLGNLAPE